MRKKLILPAVLAALVVIGAFIGWLVYDAFQNESQNPIAAGADLEALLKENADTAFSFLTAEKKELPDNMRGYVLNPRTDMDFSDLSENALKAQAQSVFEKVDAISPNAVIIVYSSSENYAPGGFHYLQYLCQAAHEQELLVILSLSEEDFPVAKTNPDKLTALAEEYDVDAVAVTIGSDTADESEKIEAIHAAFSEKGVFFGLMLPETLTSVTKGYAQQQAADFCLIQVNASSETGAQRYISDWAAVALASPVKLYAILRNDLVKSGEGWTQANELNTLVKMVYNTGGFAGCVMASLQELRTDAYDMTTNLYSYYEYFNDADYTALTLTDFALQGETAVVFTGTSDKDYPVHVWCSASEKWESVPVQGDDGTFSVEIPLRKGTNKILVKHKSALYTYFIDRAVDVLTSYSAAVEGETVTLTATAVEGARVWASLANTVLVELTAQEGGTSNGYAVYSASCELTEGLLSLKNEQVSFAALYNGLTDIVMSGETPPVTPYEDHGLGTALLCEVTNDYAETTSTAVQDDSSDPTCTPQLAGTYGAVDAFSVSSNHVTYALTTGMKLYAEDSRLIVGGYILPDNQITLNDVSYENGTSLRFSMSYPTFTKLVLAPQEYYVGYLERIYNVSEFTAEYIDVIFMDTAVCNSSTDIDFSESAVFSRAEWYFNSEENFITLRLYLREKGSFSGYSMGYDDSGNLVLSFKNNPVSLAGTVILLDPGHGGYGSPGTNYAMTVYEKDITLAIAQKAAAMLRENGATVILTREEDESVSLAERTARIRSENPDIFASIHCDGADAASWLGTHTFYYKSYSMPLASAIHQQLVKAYRTYYYMDPSSDDYRNVDKGCKFFPYNVTRVEECPSVLIECGYLTNEKDAAFLMDENGQTVMATAIAQGIVDYIVNS